MLRKSCDGDPFLTFYNDPEAQYGDFNDSGTGHHFVFSYANILEKFRIIMKGKVIVSHGSRESNANTNELAEMSRV